MYGGGDPTVPLVGNGRATARGGTHRKRTPQPIGDDADVESNATNAPSGMLRWTHMVIFILSLFSFFGVVAVSIVFRDTSPVGEVNVDWRRFDAMSPIFFTTMLQSIGSPYALVWIQIAIPFITALIHGLIALVPNVRVTYIGMVNERRNTFRWLENGLVYPLMLWTVYQLVGVTNIWLLSTLMLLSMVMCFVCWFMELLNTPDAREKNNGAVVWYPIVPISVAFVFTVALGAAYLGVMAMSARPPGSVGTPWYVYVIFIGDVVLDAGACIVAFGRLFGWPGLRSKMAGEMAPLILYFVLFSFHVWVVMVASIVG